jgi:hypothetical protein
MKSPDQLITDIAREHLCIPTLTPRTNAEPQGAPGEEPVPVALPTPLFVPKGTPLVPGKMYLQLYHGRTDPAQEMEGWGFDGPTFGPLSSYVHTYCCHFRIHGECDSSEVWLQCHDDMIRWDGCCYGDMEVFIAGTADNA